jgi:hypothetical protein
MYMFAMQELRTSSSLTETGRREREGRVRAGGIGEIQAPVDTRWVWWVKRFIRVSPMRGKPWGPFPSVNSTHDVHTFTGRQQATSILLRPLISCILLGSSPSLFARYNFFSDSVTQ